MDQDTLKMLAKVKVAARKAIGLDIDVQRLTHDHKYAAETLAKATQSDDEALVLLAITLQDRFGLLNDAPPAGQSADAKASAEKYKYGARGG
jgi:CHASE2 domain-containing sensor protein